MGSKALAPHRLLTTYLNDHLAGSIAALEILDHLSERVTKDDSSLAWLRDEIEQDQQILRQLLRRLGGSEHPLRKAAAWLSEKIGEVKLRLDDAGDGGFEMLEGLETLCLGIQGKLALWRGLAAVAKNVAELQDLDYPALERRGTRQFERADALRLAAARAALVR